MDRDGNLYLAVGGHDRPFLYGVEWGIYWRRSSSSGKHAIEASNEEFSNEVVMCGGGGHGVGGLVSASRRNGWAGEGGIVSTQVGVSCSYGWKVGRLSGAAW